MSKRQSPSWTSLKSGSLTFSRPHTVGLDVLSMSMRRRSVSGEAAAKAPRESAPQDGQAEDFECDPTDMDKVESPDAERGGNLEGGDEDPLVTWLEGIMDQHAVRHDQLLEDVKLDRNLDRAVERHGRRSKDDDPGLSDVLKGL